MMITDTYLTIEKASFGEYKEKGSKFLAYAFPFDHESELDNIMSAIHKEHPKARHYCYAYKIGPDNNRYRINDDGEPSGTAGKPIYGQILSNNLTNIIIIVVRYFGGTKLGASGLIQAYKQSTIAALDEANIVQKTISKTFRLIFDYENMGNILNAIKESGIEIAEKNFNETAEVSIKIRASESEKMIHLLKAAIIHKSPEEINPDEEIEICNIIQED
jgi:uncharacterized YigZ family protein